MDYVVPFDQLGVANPGPWTNASPQAGQKGSIVNANVFPAVQGEILSVQDEAGLTRDGTSTSQMLQAIRSGKLTFFVDSGTADALVITPRTSFPNFAAGLELAILKNPSVGPNATKTPKLSAGPLQMTLVKEDGSALAVGDLAGLFTVRSDGTALRVQGLRKSDASSGLHLILDNSSSAATITATTATAVTARATDAAYLVIPNNACAGATTINAGFGVVAFTRSDGSALQSGDYVAQQPLLVVDDGTNIRIVTMVPSQLTASTASYVSSYVSNYVTNNYAKGSLIARRVFGTPGSQAYTPTPGTNRIRVTVQGAGGMGGPTPAVSGSQFYAAGAGGAGGIAVSDIASSFSGATITVGAGSSTTGTPGGTSSFGSFLSATGGTSPGVGVAYTTPQAQTGGFGGTGSGGNVSNGNGASGALGVAFSNGNLVAGSGAASLFGAGGNSVFTSNSGGQPASAYGAGGGGACANSASASLQGGVGGNGVVIIEEYA